VRSVAASVSLSGLRSRESVNNLIGRNFLTPTVPHFQASILLRLFPNPSPSAARFTLMSAEQMNAIPYMNFTTSDHVAVQREFTIEFLEDFLKHPVMILFQGIGIKRRHDTTAAKVLNPNGNVPDA
jgi:hypothetical protein